MRDTILEFIVRWCTKHGRHRTIYDRDGTTPYMERYYLLFRNRPRWFPFNVTLHKICLSDLPVLHDHPWGYATIILKGSYIEHTMRGEFNRAPGHFRFRSAESYHWLEVPSDEPCWTLFFMGKRRREWGFLNGTTWMPWQEYINWRAGATVDELAHHKEFEVEMDQHRKDVYGNHVQRRS